MIHKNAILQKLNLSENLNRKNVGEKSDFCGENGFFAVFGTCTYSENIREFVEEVFEQSDWLKQFLIISKGNISILQDNKFYRRAKKLGNLLNRNYFWTTALKDSLKTRESKTCNSTFFPNLTKWLTATSFVCTLHHPSKNKNSGWKSLATNLDAFVSQIENQNWHLKNTKNPTTRRWTRHLWS